MSEKILLDTDIGSDVDDALVVGAVRIDGGGFDGDVGLERGEIELLDQGFFDLENAG